MRRILVTSLLAAAAFGGGLPARATGTCKELPTAAGMTIGACLPYMDCRDACYWHPGDVYCHRTPAKAAARVDVCTGVVDDL